MELQHPKLENNTQEAVLSPAPVIAATTPVVDTERADKRRDLALWMLFGSALIMTFSALLAMLLISKSSSHVFWLGVAAHVNIFLTLSAIGGLIVKRNLEIDRQGIKFDDRDQPSGRNNG